MAEKNGRRVMVSVGGQSLNFNADKMLANPAMVEKRLGDATFTMYGKDGKPRTVSGREFSGAVKLGWGFEPKTQPQAAAPVAPAKPAQQPQAAPQQKKATPSGPNYMQRMVGRMNSAIDALQSQQATQRTPSQQTSSRQGNALLRSRDAMIARTERAAQRAPQAPQVEAEAPAETPSRPSSNQPPSFNPSIYVGKEQGETSWQDTYKMPELRTTQQMDVSEPGKAVKKETRRLEDERAQENKRILANPKGHTQAELMAAAKDVMEESVLPKRKRATPYTDEERAIANELQMRSPEARENIADYLKPKIDKRLQSAQGEIDKSIRASIGKIESETTQRAIESVKWGGSEDMALSEGESRLNIENITKALTSNLDATIQKLFKAEDIKKDIESSGMDEEEYYMHFANAVADQIYSTAFDELVRRKLPKNAIDYLLSSARNNIINNVINAITRTQEQKEIAGQAEYLTQTERNPYYNPSTGMQLAGTAVSFATDIPAMGAIGKGINAMMPMTRVAMMQETMRLANKGWVGRLGVGTGRAALSTYLNFTGYNVLSTVASNAATGQKTTMGHIVEAAENPGALIGVTGKMFGNLFARVGVNGMERTTAQWLKNASKKMLVRAGAFATETSSFAIGEWLLGDHSQPLTIANFIESGEQLVAMKIGGMLGHAAMPSTKSQPKRSLIGRAVAAIDPRASVAAKQRLSPDVRAEIDRTKSGKDFFEHLDVLVSTLMETQETKAQLKAAEKSGDVDRQRELSERKAALEHSYKELTNELSWDAENALNIAVFGVATGVRPRASMFKYHGDKVEEIGPDGMLLAVKYTDDKEQQETWVKGQEIHTVQYDTRSIMQMAHDAGLERILTLDPTSEEFNQLASEFMEIMKRNGKTDMVQLVKEMHDAKTDVGKLFLAYLSDKTGVDDALRKRGLSSEDAERLLTANPDELNNGDLVMLNLIYKDMEALIAKPGEVHTEISGTSGRKTAEESGAGGETPDVNIIKTLSDEVDAAQQAYDKWIQDKNEVAQAFNQYLQASDGDLLAAYMTMLRGQQATEQELAAVADLINAQSKQNAFMEATQDKIEENVSRFVNLVAHTEDENGLVYTVIDQSGKRWFVKNGDFEERDGNVVITDEAGLIVVVDEQGNVRSLKGNGIKLESKRSREDVANIKRKQLEDINSQVITEAGEGNGAQTGETPPTDDKPADNTPKEGDNTPADNPPADNPSADNPPTPPTPPKEGGNPPEPEPKNLTNKDIRENAENDAERDLALDWKSGENTSDAARQAYENISARIKTKADEAARLKAEKEAADKAAAEEAERKAKEEAERKAKEEAERKAAEEAARLKAEKEEAERKAKEEAERKAAEEEERRRAEEEEKRKDIKEKEDIIKADEEATEDEKQTALEYLHGESKSDLDKFIYESIMRRHEGNQQGQGEEENKGDGQGKEPTPPAFKSAPLSAEEQESSRAFDAAVEAQNDRGPDAQIQPKKAPVMKIADFADGKNSPRKPTKGVFHDPDGFGVVTNGYIVYYDRGLFDEAQTGKVISVGSDKSIPQGTEIEGRFPNWKSVIPSNEQMTYTFNPQQLAEIIAGIESKVKKTWQENKGKNKGKLADELNTTTIYIRFADGRIVAMRLNTLKNFALAAQKLGATEIQTVQGLRAAGGNSVLYTRTEQGGILAMSVDKKPTIEDSPYQAGLDEFFVDLKDSRPVGLKAFDAPGKESQSSRLTQQGSADTTPTETASIIDHENRRENADREGGSLSRKEEDQQRVDAATQRVKDLLKGWGKRFVEAGRNSDKLMLNMTLFNEEQWKMFGELLRASTNLGYELARMGYHKFEDWSKEIANAVGDAIKQATGWDDNDIVDFCEQLWEQKFTDEDGNRRKLSEHASEFEKKSVTLPEGDSIEQHPEVERTEKEDDFIVAVGSTMRARLKNGGKALDLKELRKIAKDFGLEDVSDTDLQELAELAAVQEAKKVLKDAAEGAREITKEEYDQIVSLHEKQPSLSKRDSDRIEKQQYSTPTPLAAAMSAFLKKGKAGKTQKVLEPSAGNGALTIGFPREDVHVNDIDFMRVRNLRKQGFGQVTTQDGRKPFAGKYDVVVTNPPFSTPGTKLPPMTIDGFTLTGLDGQMAVNALASMKDDGRAAIVIGGNSKYNDTGVLIGGKDRSLLGYLYQHYNVVDVINVDGSLYKKNGTGYAVRIILIDGRRTDQSKKHYPPTREKARSEAVKSFDELWERVNEYSSKDKEKEDVLTDSENGGEHSEPVVEGEQETDGVGTHGDVGGDGKQGTGTGEPVRPELHDGGLSGLDGHSSEDNGEDGENNGGRPGGRGGSPSRTGAGDTIQHGSGESPVVGGGGQEHPTDAGDRHDVGGERPGGRGLSGAGGAGGRPSASGTDDINVHNGRPVEPEGKKESKVSLADEKVDYVPRSKGNGLGTKTPAALVQQTRDTLARIGDVDQFVCDKLGYANKQELYSHLGGEQIDAVAAAIYQMERGNGFIIGDGTGVGKGRQAAALLRYGMRLGKVPIFVTQKPQLFTDIYRDMIDIGGESDFRPLIINNSDTKTDISVFDEKTGKYKTLFKGLKNDKVREVLDYVREHGKLPPYVTKQGRGKKAVTVEQEYTCVLITYSQVAAGTMEYEDGKAKPKKLKGPAASNQISGDLKRELLTLLARDNIVVLDESHTAAGAASGYFMDALKDAAGVTYLSGTFAKRPDSMPLYALKTAIAKGVDSVRELIAAVQRGGVTLQEIMSQQLAKAGQMIRRERPTEGVVNEWVKDEDPVTVEQQQGKADALTDIFNDIIAFQNTYVKEYLDALRDKVRDTLILIGERPGKGNLGINNVPFASKTYNLVRQMTLALKVDQAADRAIAALKAGRKPIITVSNTMEKFLTEFVGEEPVPIPDLAASMIRGLQGAMVYEEKDSQGIKQRREINLSDMTPDAQRAYKAIEEKIGKASTGLTLSPIDAMIHKLQEAGYKVGELTGRKDMLEFLPGGMVRRVPRSEKDKKKLADQFNLGQIDALIINKSSATGISLHSGARPTGFNLEQADTRQREMILAQLEADINDAIQVLGRINRTGQVYPAMYTYLMSNVPAENRLLMMYQAKVNSLFANTSGDQKSTENKVDVVDIINKYGDQVVAEYLAENTGLYEALLDPFKLKWREATSYDEAREQLGDISKIDMGGEWASKVLSRLALLPVKEQVRIMEEIEERYRTKIDILNESGENTLVMNELPLRAKTLKTEVVKTGSDPEGDNPFAGHTYAETVECDVLVKPMSAAETHKAVEKMLDGKTPEQQRDDILAQIKSKQDDELKKLEESYEHKIEKTKEAQINKTKRALIKERKEGKNNLSDEEIEQIAAQTAMQKETELRDELAGKRRDLSRKYNGILEWLESFKPGDTVSVPFEGDDSGVFRLARIIGWNIGKSLTPASSSVIIATADGRRKVTIPMSDRAKFRTIVAETQKYTAQIRVMSHDENWEQYLQRGGAGDVRETRVIYTGNLLAVLASGSPGRIVRYTTDTGEVKTGVLLPKGVDVTNFDELPISAALERLRGGEVITSTNGDITIKKRDGYSFEVRVPRSTKRGGNYFLDNVLRSYVRGGNFVTIGDNMVAVVPKENLPAFLDRLSTEHKIKVKPVEKPKEEDASGSDDMVGDNRVSFRTENESDFDGFDNFELDRFGIPKTPKRITSLSQAAWWVYDMISKVRGLLSPKYSKDYSRVLAHGNTERKIDLKEAGHSQIKVEGLLDVIQPRLEQALRNSTSPEARRHFENLIAECKRARDWYERAAKGDTSILDEDKPMFSVLEGDGELTTPQRIKERETVRRRTKELSDKYGVPIKLIESVSDVKNRHAREAILSGERVTGWYDESTGEVCFYLPNIRSSWRNPKVESVVEKLFVHEVVAHKGLRHLLGEEKFNKLCDDVWEMMKRTLPKEKIDEAMRNLSVRGIKDETEARRKAADEYMATLGEKGIDRSLKDRVISFVRNALRKMGVKIDLSDRDIIDMLARSRKNLEKLPEPDKVNPSGRFKEAVKEESRPHFHVDDTPSSDISDPFDTARRIAYEERAQREEEQSIPKDKRADTPAQERYDDLAKSNDPDKRRVMFSTAPDPYDRIDAAAQKKQYEDSVKTGAFYWHEAWVDSLSALKELMKSLIGKKDLSGVLDIHNAYTKATHLSSVVQDQRKLFIRDCITPLKDSLDKCMKHLSGDYKYRYEEMHDYMWMKSALERNRVFRVRDYVDRQREKNIKSPDDLGVKAKQIYDILKSDPAIDWDSMTPEQKADKELELARKAQKQFADDVWEEWNKKRREMKQKLDTKNVDLKGFYAELDAWIKGYISRYKPGKKDYSGLNTAVGGFDADGLYDDAKAIQDVMDFEDRIPESELIQLWTDWRRVTDTSLKKAYDTELMTKDTYDHISGMMDWYVPMRKWQEQMAEDISAYFHNPTSDSAGGILTKKAKGRESRAEEDIFAVALQIADNAILQGEQNRVKQALWKLAHATKATDGHGLLSKSQYWEVRTFDPSGNEVWTPKYAETDDTMTGDEVAAKVKEFNEEMAQLAVTGDARPMQGSLELPYRFVRAAHRNEHIVEVSIGGNKHLLYLNGSPRAAQAINGMLHPDHQGHASDFVARANRYLAATFTSWSPKFVLRNLFRDFNFAFTNVFIKNGQEGATAKKLWLDGYTTRFLKNWGKALVLSPFYWREYETGKANVVSQATGRTSDLFKEFLRNGGKTGYVAQKDLDRCKAIMTRSLAEGKTTRAAREVIFAIPHLLEGFNNWAENVARFAVYSTSRQAGRSILQSVADAKDASTNFNRKGAYSATAKGQKAWSAAWTAGVSSSMARGLWLFLNPGVQSLSLTKRNFKEHPARAILGYTAHAALSAVWPALMAYWISSQFGDEEDGPQNKYENLPEYDRMSNLCFYMGKGNWLKLPVSIETSAAWGAGQMFSAYFCGHDELKGTINPAIEAASLMTGLLPVDPLASDGKNLWVSISPTLLAPVVQNMMNAKWTGSPIEREKAPWNKNEPRYKRATSSTAAAMVGLCEWLSDLTSEYGDSEIKKGWMDISPGQAENLVKGYLGGMGGFVVDVISTAETLASDEGADLRHMPLVNGLYSKTDNDAESFRINTRFYALKEKMEEDASTLSNAKKKVDDADPRTVATLKAVEDKVGQSVARWKEIESELNRLGKIAKNPSSEEEAALALEMIMELRESATKEFGHW